MKIGNKVRIRGTIQEGIIIDIKVSLGKIWNTSSKVTYYFVKLSNGNLMEYTHEELIVT